MSLLLNGAKTATIAGSEMQCVEIYMGESYTFPFAFKDSTGSPVNITGWTLATSVKYYTCNITYPAGNATTEEINISNLTYLTGVTGPSIPSAITNGANGLGYIYVPTTITPSGHEPTLADTTSLLAIVSLSVSRTDALSGQTDTNLEPIGLIIRYL